MTSAIIKYQGLRFIYINIRAAYFRVKRGIVIALFTMLVHKLHLCIQSEFGFNVHLGIQHLAKVLSHICDEKCATI